MAITITIQDEALRSRLQQLVDTVSNPRPVLENFHAYVMRQTDRTFRQLKRGGAFRGVVWEPFKDQYTRKTDGVTVPAWGGVPKLRGQGTVLGRLRPSGKRVTPGSSLLHDSGAMRTRAGQDRIWEDGGKTLRMSTRGLVYAPKQQSRRLFLFFALPEDQDQFVKMALRWIERQNKPGAS